MAQYVFTMNRVGKIVPPKRQILKDISLSFFPGAKIGVLGLNGSGKSTLLKIMAGIDKEIEGEAIPMPGLKIGYLPQEPQLDPEHTVRQAVESGMGEVMQAKERLEAIYAAYADFFTRHDLLLCPTTPTVSWPVDQLGPAEIGGQPAGPRGHAVFTPLFNYAQAPACSVPAGLARGLPVGLQVVGRRYDDAGVLAMAAHLERLAGPQPRPALWNEA